MKIRLYKDIFKRMQGEGCDVNLSEKQYSNPIEWVEKSMTEKLADQYIEIWSRINELIAKADVETIKKEFIIEFDMDCNIKSIIDKREHKGIK